MELTGTRGLRKAKGVDDSNSRACHAILQQVIRGHVQPRSAVDALPRASAKSFGPLISQGSAERADIAARGGHVVARQRDHGDDRPRRHRLRRRRPRHRPRPLRREHLGQVLRRLLRPLPHPPPSPTFAPSSHPPLPTTAATTPPPPLSSSAATSSPAPPSTRCHGRALRASVFSSHRAPPNEPSSRRAGAMSSRDNKAAAAIARAAAAFDGAVLGIDLALCVVSTWAKYFAAFYALHRICLAPSAPISNLRSLIPSSSSDDGGNDAAAALVVVRGNVQPCSVVVALPRASAASTWATNEPSS